ncbi:MAG TPA: VWA domain-containing protein [Pseudomonas sp.]|nr:VWA domain-containing protein [Pseudomonas sp.]
MTELWPTLLRPAWLLLLVPCAWLLWNLWRRERRSARWQLLLPRPFHVLLLSGEAGRSSRLPWLALGLAWLLALLALLGPSWQRMEQATASRGDALVAILDLTPRMLAADLSPSRLEQARRTLVDLLEARRGAQTGIVVYAGSAHVLVPLSDDLGTALNLLGALRPSIMPEPGQRADLAVARALDLLEQAGQSSGRLLLLTSGLSDREQAAIAALSRDGNRLDVLGVGTARGAPIVLEDGSFLKDAQGAIVLQRLDTASHERFARQLGGVYQPLRPDSADLRALGLLETTGGEAQTGQALSLEHWVDQGYWLLLPLLLLAACAGRRGWLFCLPLLFMPVPGHAADFLWLRADQQGQRLLDAGRPEEAATLFTDPQRQGYALYLAGQYAEAAERFAAGDEAANHYNRGNALALSDQLETALHAYDQALELDPQLEQARHNRQQVEELLRQRLAERERQQEQAAASRDAPGGQSSPIAGGAGEQPTDAEPEPGSAQPGESSPPSEATAGSQGGAGSDGDPTTATATQAPLDRERRQALEQWLRQIPDDPAELLRRKFRLEQQQRQETP